jgi:hypothetical protein
MVNQIGGVGGTGGVGGAVGPSRSLAAGEVGAVTRISNGVTAALLPGSNLALAATLAANRVPVTT